MNKYIRYAVWAFSISILASGVALTQRAFGAEDYKTLSHQYNIVYVDLLIKKIKTFHKGTPVILFFKDGSTVEGIFKGYSGYDDSIWVKEEHHWLQSGYGISELFDISIAVKRPV
jgi:predicted oxidoreductase (fatty acid repression mutant protein)